MSPICRTRRSISISPFSSRKVLEFVGVVEVILDGALLAAGDDDHLLDAGS